MFTKFALCENLSRKTVARVHRYLFDFGQGAHRVFWNGERAFIETDCPDDIGLLREQFPGVVHDQARTQGEASR